MSGVDEFTDISSDVPIEIIQEFHQDAKQEAKRVVSIKKLSAPIRSTTEEIYKDVTQDITSGEEQDNLIAVRAFPKVEMRRSEPVSKDKFKKTDNFTLY